MKARVTKLTEKAKKKGKIVGKKLYQSLTEIKETTAKKILINIVADDPMFVPKYQTEGSANCDLVANVPTNGNGVKQVSIVHRGTVLIDCGFSMEIPPGYKANIMARSGLASKGLIVTNGPGQIDSDYRHRIKVIVTNVGAQNPIVINHGDRIAQMSIEPVYMFDWNIVSELSETSRAGGFGSTGQSVFDKK